MNTRFRGNMLALLALITATVCSGTGDAAGPELIADHLTPAAVYRPKPPLVIDSTFLNCLQKRPSDSVKVWVFFTDKAVVNKSEFAKVASSVALTERAAKRRAKVGLSEIVFADLPVASKYVREIESLGGRHRRSSRWLNAASFEMAAPLVERITKLPFVTEIRQMAQFRRSPEEPVDIKDVPQQGAGSTDALNYGNSFQQLNQIGVPAVHDKGYTGQGVTLAILDTGMRKTHQAFAAHFAQGRVLAEYDFVHNDGNVANEPGDWASEQNHGTQVWSVAGGEADGYLYGPAYRANFILCKTEDVRSELPTEEDNWVAGMEFADSVGTDVITTSLGYKVFDDSCNCNYSYSDMDGQTATTSIAAGMADGLGIVLCKSAGNEGPGSGSITAPADAFDILTVGAVDVGGTIAYFSSRGPTYDGRIKPEVCARGVSTTCAQPTTDNSYTSASGTSFATPLLGGAACLVIEAHPEWTPAQVREALKLSGNRASSPDNNYGWGIINVDSALRVDFGCCTGRVGDANNSGDDVPSIGDISVMIDAKFITGTCDGILICLTEADINQSGGANPTCEDITIGDISILIDHLFISGQSLPDCM